MLNLVVSKVTGSLWKVNYLAYSCVLRDTAGDQ